ncbi:OprO/OprP family phosphate-selective porin [Lysobacter changpingensis]|uniref:OprO/OprP family phosphate-selective porin n=1 Tax=Lysobacter changpingensis TaxID=2792784 RepID=UPI001A8EB4EA|nr:porin [Lysobacter changpingensis]
MSHFPIRSLAIALAVAALPVCAHAGAVSFKPTGVIYYDNVEAQPDVKPFEDVDKVRSARLGFVLKAGERWQINVEHEFTDRSTPDVYLQFTPAKGHALRLGQFKQPFLMEDATSARQTPMMDASLLGAFALGRRIGVGYGWSDADHAVNAAVFGKRLDGKNEGVGMAVRASRALHFGEDLLHLGVGAAVDSPDSESARFSSKPETALATSSLVDTGTIVDVDRVERAGLEALWIGGAWSVQAEAAAVHATRDGEADLRGTGGYALASWSPSGHRRNYKAGTVSAPTVGDGTAWELVLRYSVLDLDSAASRGGVESDWNLGATWYLNRYARVMANYVIADSRRRDVDDDPRLLLMRLQVQF